MNIAELRSHVDGFINSVDAAAADHLRQFADWLEGKQAEEAKVQEAISFVQAHGYTVTK